MSKTNKAKQLLQKFRDSNWTKLLNGVLFYVGWFICVANGASGSLLYLTVTIAIICTHLVYARDWMKEVILLLTIVPVGFCIDSVYILTGVIQFTTPNPFITWGAPLWMLAVYALFASSIEYSLSWIKHHLFGAAVLGAIGGPICYKVGVKMGAATFLLEGGKSFVVIGTVWFFFMPLVYAYSRYLDRYR